MFYISVLDITISNSTKKVKKERKRKREKETERERDRRKERKRKKERKKKKGKGSGESLCTQPPLEGARRPDIVSGPPEFHPSCCRAGHGRLG